MSERTIAQYRVEAELGRGGMGVVYRARDTRLGREVALKLLPAESPDAAARDRQLHEARMASALNHPHIATLYEVGETDNQFFIAMELVEGKSLAALVAAGGLPTETVARYGAQIADALDHAHARNIVHRDLKSANVIVTPEGRAKVLDFGLAQRVQPERLDEVTRSQMVLGEVKGVAGTLPYMAPEQLRGEPADARTDLWALGVVLHEMAAGKLPFSGTTGFSLSSAILRESSAALPEQVPPGLRAVIQRCLAKDAGQRYQRASEVRAALEALSHGSAASTATAAAPSARKISWNWILAPAALLVLLAVLFTLNVGGLRQRILAPTGRPKIESIAVLPLENLSGDPSQEFFADGMTEALISSLAQIGALKVISRTSVMGYKGTRKSLPEIARELKVDAVVEGSVARSGGRVRITAQLIHAATDTHLWAKDYDRDLSDVLKLQGEVARAIAEEIRVQLTPRERERLSTTQTVNPAAHEAYLLGRYYWNKRTEEGLQKGVQYFQQAIEKDPSYALAYVGLADSYSLLAGYSPVSPREGFPRAKAAAMKALELDGQSAEAHTSLGLILVFYEWDWPGGEREFQRAIELNPSYATAHHWYAHHLICVGRFDEAEAQMKLAEERDPLSPTISTEVGYPLFFARRYDLAIQAYRKALEIHPDFFRAHWLVGQAYEQKGQYAEAIAAFQNAVKLSGGNAVMRAALAQGLAVSGRKDEAQKILEDLKHLSKERYFSPYFIAEIYLGLGRKEEAFQWLERAYNEHDYFIRWLKVDPMLDALRGDPRFQVLLQRMNFPK